MIRAARQLAVPCLLLVLAGCQQSGPRLQPVSQAWAADHDAVGEADSLVFARSADGTPCIIATDKKANRLDVFAAATGQRLEVVGAAGDGLGEFRYPNGVAVVSFPEGAGTADFLLIVERDNQRVQALRLPYFAPAGCPVKTGLVRPYGIAVAQLADGWYAYVTDETAPLNARVQRYRLSRRGVVIAAEPLGGFGATTGAGVIHEPESVVVDVARGRVLLCDEAVAGKNVKVYTLVGDFTGTTFADGLIAGDPEGIALVADNAGGTVIVTDQQPDVTIWLLFDAETYQLLARVTGVPTIANTDGIAVAPYAIGPFGGGLLAAVHSDQQVRAYPLAALLAAVGRQPALEQP